MSDARPQHPHRPHLDEVFITNDQRTHPTWTRPMVQRVRAIEWRVVLEAFAITLLALVLIAIAVGLYAVNVRPHAGDSDAQSDGAFLAMAHLGTFFGYAVGGFWLRRHSVHDPFLHGACLVLCGLVLSFFLVLGNAALGYPLQDWLPSSIAPQHTAAIEFILSPWIIIFAALPATMMAVAFVPGKGVPLEADINDVDRSGDEL